MPDRDQLLRLTELQMNQAARRRAMHGHHELTEIRAIKYLAAAMYPGGNGVIEVEAWGLIYVGNYHPADMDNPPGRRRRQLILQGNTHAELQQQARLLGFNV